MKIGVKIGVAIPTYNKDLLLVNRCLRSIERQSRKPNLVAISASQCGEEDIKIISQTYSFPLKIVHTYNAQNAATNRNKAANELSGMDIITFVDSDDEMYETRLEYLERAFSENKVDFVLHGYLICKSYEESLLYKKLNMEYTFFDNSILPNPTHCGVLVNPICVPDNKDILTHGHISVRQNIFEEHKYQEGSQYVLWEDAEYCRRLTDKGLRGGFLNCKLTKYHDYRETEEEMRLIKRVEDIYTKKICVATYSDSKYLDRAKKTINDIRQKAYYNGDIVLMTDGLFQVDENYIKENRLLVKEFPDIDVSSLLQKIKAHPFVNSDKREYEKTKQWNKLYAFHAYLKQYDYVMFVDAGLRIFDSIEHFYPCFEKDSLVALDDGHPDFTKKFNCQIQLTNTVVVERLKEIYDIDSSYFLNCIFLYDTNIITDHTLSDLINMMNEYPICRTNEMGIMNIYFHKVWKPLNIYLQKNKILFDWSERGGNNWNVYISLKYPTTFRD